MFFHLFDVFAVQLSYYLTSEAAMRSYAAGNKGFTLVEAIIATFLTAIAVTAMFAVVLSSLTGDNRSDYRMEAEMDLKRAADAMRDYVVSADTSAYANMASMAINTSNTYGATLPNVWGGPCQVDTTYPNPFSNNAPHNIACLAANSRTFPTNAPTFVYRVNPLTSGYSAGLYVSSVTFELMVPTTAY